MIITSDNKIIAIDKKENISKYDKTFSIIDLGDYTILPGLIDAHAHPNNNSDDYQIGHLKILLLQKH